MNRLFDDALRSFETLSLPESGELISHLATSAEGDVSASPRVKQGTVDGVMQHLINLEEIGDDHGGRG